MKIIFGLTVKDSLIFGKRFTISFSEIELFVIARTFDIRLPESGNGRSLESRRHQNLAISDHWNTAGAGIQRHPVTVAGCRRTGIRQWSETGRI
jgi:hypothetical protein